VGPPAGIGPAARIALQIEQKLPQKTANFGIERLKTIDGRKLKNRVCTLGACWLAAERAVDSGRHFTASPSGSRLR
jgi:hypothetical protein